MLTSMIRVSALVMQISMSGAANTLLLKIYSNYYYLTLFQHQVFTSMAAVEVSRIIVYPTGVNLVVLGLVFFNFKENNFFLGRFAQNLCARILGF